MSENAEHLPPVSCIALALAVVRSGSMLRELRQFLYRVIEQVLTHGDRTSGSDSVTSVTSVTAITMTKRPAPTSLATMESEGCLLEEQQQDLQRRFERRFEAMYLHWQTDDEGCTECYRRRMPLAEVPEPDDDMPDNHWHYCDCVIAIPWGHALAHTVKNWFLSVQCPCRTCHPDAGDRYSRHMDLDCDVTATYLVAHQDQTIEALRGRLPDDLVDIVIDY